MATVVIVRVFLVVTMLSIGLRLADSGSIRDVLGPRLLVPVLAANILLIPVIAIALAALFHLEGPVAAGFLAAGIAPAGSMAPKFVQFARGDLRVAVATTFGLAAVAAFTVAPTLALANTVLGLPPEAAPVDLGLVAVSLLIFQLAPTVVGWAIARGGPGLARRAVEPLTAASTVLIAVLVVVALADTVGELGDVGVAPIAAMVLLILAALGIGRSLGGDAVVRRATMVVTAQRSAALGLLVVAGVGHPLATATVAVFALVLLVVNGGVAVALGRDLSGVIGSRVIGGPTAPEEAA